jgi:hypothetical protein
MPFDKYEDFDDCVKKNQDKKDPEGYCAEIERKTKEAEEAKKKPPPPFQMG